MLDPVNNYEVYNGLDENGCSLPGNNIANWPLIKKVEDGVVIIPTTTTTIP